MKVLRNSVQVNIASQGFDCAAPFLPARRATSPLARGPIGFKGLILTLWLDVDWAAYVARDLNDFSICAIGGIELPQCDLFSCRGYRARG